MCQLLIEMLCQLLTEMLNCSLFSTNIPRNVYDQEFVYLVICVLFIPDEPQSFRFFSFS